MSTDSPKKKPMRVVIRNNKIIPLTKSLVKRIKNLRSRKWSWRRISNKLNEEGILSKEGNKWYDGSLYNVMRNYL